MSDERVGDVIIVTTCKEGFWVEYRLDGRIARQAFHYTAVFADMTAHAWAMAYRVGVAFRKDGRRKCPRVSLMYDGVNRIAPPITK